MAILVVLALVVAACSQPWLPDDVIADIPAPTTIPPVVPRATPPPPTEPPAGTTPDAPPVTTPPELPRYSATWQTNDCPMDVFADDVDRVQCGTLVVPVDRTRPDDGDVALAVAIVKSAAAEPASDPVVYLHGGPGGFALLDHDTWLFPEHPLLAERDLILIDQRGSGYSVPSLNCPEALDAVNLVRALRRCRERVAADGLDVNRFSTAEIAADVDDLRRALGYAEWNLYGVSYGTRVALTALAQNDTGIRSVILDSAYPPEVEAFEEQAVNGSAALRSLFAACAAQPACATRFGDLEPLLEIALAELREQPVTVEVDDPFYGEVVEIDVDHLGLAGELFGSMYSSTALASIPLAIGLISSGDVEAGMQLLAPLDGYSSNRRQDDDYNELFDAELAHWVPECREEMAYTDTNAAAAAIDGSAYASALLADLPFQREVCTVLEVDPADPSTQLPVVSDVPTLILAGEFDPITPPKWGFAAADDLREAELVLIPSAGHAPSFDDCGTELVEAFIADPVSPLDLSCADTVAPVDFDLG